MEWLVSSRRAWHLEKVAMEIPTPSVLERLLRSTSTREFSQHLFQLGLLVGTVGTAKQERYMSGVYIATWKGDRIDLLDPDPALVTLEEIAEGLSREGRFHNKTAVPYTVAQHCLEVSNLCPTWEGKIWGLLHDASDAYHRDLASMLKNHPAIQGFWKAMELRWLQMFAEKFHLDLPMPPEVKHADRVMLCVERRLLLPDTQAVAEQFKFNEENLGYVPNRTLLVLTRMEAKIQYLGMFELLMKQRLH